jgi:PhnB protein
MIQSHSGGNMPAKPKRAASKARRAAKKPAGKARRAASKPKGVQRVPQGFPTITPHLVVKGANEAIEFYDKISPD